MLGQFFGKIPHKLIHQIDELAVDIQSETCREDIRQLLKRTVLVGGKRLRPLLTAMMGQFFNTPWEHVAPLARTIEMIHAASLAHDDVVDSAQVRRGIPSINALAGNKRAVLAGDYLLADVIDHLAQLKHPLLLQTTAQVIKELAVGEWLQYEAALNRRYSHQILYDIAYHKTASVMSWCTRSCAVWMNHPENIVKLANQFGVELGIAFQLIDDTLDFSENSKKDLLLDLKNGQVNSVVYEWLQLSPEKLQQYLNGQELQELWNEQDLKEAVSQVRKRALTHLQTARSILNALDGELPRDIGKNEEREGKESLLWLMNYLENRSN